MLDFLIIGEYYLIYIFYIYRVYWVYIYLLNIFRLIDYVSENNRYE